jgi:hypothetical protein
MTPPQIYKSLRAPKIKLIHIDTGTWKVNRAESLEAFSLELRFEKRWSKLFCISAVTIPVT